MTLMLSAMIMNRIPLERNGTNISSIFTFELALNRMNTMELGDVMLYNPQATTTIKAERTNFKNSGLYWLKKGKYLTEAYTPMMMKNHGNGFSNAKKISSYS